MKVLIVTSSIDPASGGPTRSCKGMSRSLSQVGVNVTLLVLRGHHAFENPCGVNVLYAEDAAKVCPCAISEFDVVHIQGLWDLKLHKVIMACRAAKVPYIISPRGMLDPWALSVKRCKKMLAMFAYQHSDLRHALAFHATAEMEAEHIRKFGLDQAIVIASNGVEVPENIEALNSKVVSQQRTALFLSRLHPGKGLLTLAEAWARVRPQGWTMRVVGPDLYGHKAKVLAELDSLGIRDQWEFVDMVDDETKWLEYARADLLVHPSISENFGITIAEGLSAGLPVICTKGTPWAELPQRRCGWWVEQGVDSLATALKDAVELPASVRKDMGKAGRSLILEKYTWGASARVLVEWYRQHLGCVV